MLHGVNLEGIATDAKKALVALAAGNEPSGQAQPKAGRRATGYKMPGVKRFLDQVTKLSKAQALAGTAS